MVTNAFVVPLNALNTTIVGSSVLVINPATWFIRSGLPTDVPPNFITFIYKNFKVSVRMDFVRADKDKCGEG
jgi:hypothetical protein